MTVEAPARSDPTARELEALMAEARRRARRRRVGYAAGALALLLAVGGILLLGGGEGADHARDEGNPRAGAATGKSGLLFVRAVVKSDEGVFAIDVATGKIKKLHLPGLNCGDTPFCLISSGDELVISSVGRTTAYNPAARGRHGRARLGNGWITVPSTTDGRVWLGILARGKLGGPHRRGLSAVREIDLEGNVVDSMRPPGGRWPVGAVESGLLFQYARNLRLWSLEERRFTARIPGVYPADTSGSLVASCPDRCPKYLLTDTRTGETARIAPPDGYRWLGGYEGAFSPSGSHLALPIARAGDGARPWHADGLAVIGIQARDAQVIPSPGIDPVYHAMAWSSEGDRLFFVDADGTVMSYRLGSDGPTAQASFDSKDAILQMVSVRPRD
jgi:hypothetical protein